MWSISEQRHILPDLEVANNIINKLNEKFDSRDIYHHSSNQKEMFEFIYSLDSSKREAWEITFLGYCVASGGGHGFGRDYEDCCEDDYMHMNIENEKVIYEMAYNGVIELISKLITIISYSDIGDEQKKKWLLTLSKNIKTN